MPLQMLAEQEWHAVEWMALLPQMRPPQAMPMPPEVLVETPLKAQEQQQQVRERALAALLPGVQGPDRQETHTAGNGRRCTRPAG